MTTIATMSDTHGLWNQLNYPKADILILAGDILKNYSRDPMLDSMLQEPELTSLNSFFGDLLANKTYSSIVMISGNHDRIFERRPEAKNLLTNAHYLQDTEIVLDGIKFFGSPWQPWFCDWSFNFPPPGTAESKRAAQLCWSAIPDNTDILITHGPPYGILDLTYDGRNVGCPYLRDRIDHLPQLKLHIFGHIHYSHGLTMRQKTMFANAAICGEDYAPTNPVHIINV